MRETHPLRASTSLAVLVLFAFAGLVGAGCADRTHIRDDFGERVYGFYLAQRVHEHAAVDSPSGLDAEEAGIIQAKYRKSMGGGSGSAGTGQMMQFSEPRDRDSK